MARIQQSTNYVPRAKNFPTAVLDQVTDPTVRSALQAIMQNDDQWAQQVAHWANNALGLKTFTGSKSGTDYPITSTSLAQVDGTNLATTIIVPYGNNLLLRATGMGYQSAGGATLTIALTDGATVLNETIVNVVSITPWVVEVPFVGDGMSHTFELQAAVSSGTGHLVNQATQFIVFSILTQPAGGEAVT